MRRGKTWTHLGSWLFGAVIIAIWVLPGRVPGWAFIALFALAFVLGPITSGRWRPRTPSGPAPKLPYKQVDVHTSPEPSDTKAVAKRIGLDG